MYAFLRSPKWLAGHALALIGVVTFASLGVWQLRRLDEVRTRNALVEQRLAAPERPVGEVLAEVAGDGADQAADALRYRRVAATGTFDVDEEILVSLRSYQGQPGHHVLTPLMLDDGTALVVNRGWVPLALDEPPVAEAVPTAQAGERVTVTGILREPDEASSFGPQAGAGEASQLGRVDLVRYQQQVDAPLAPVYLLAQAQQPAGPTPLPRTLAPPDLDEGPHLGYAGQWFLFAAVVGVGYPLLLRRTARERVGEGADAAPREQGAPVGAGR